MAFKRVNKVIIGADIAALDLTAPWALQAAALADVIGEGEVIVLDENKQPLAVGADYGDTAGIYIAVGTGNTFQDTVTNDWHREVEVSDFIDGQHVSEYMETVFQAAVEQVTTVDLGTLVPEIGEEYAIKLIYKDLYEHPAFYSHTYRVTAATNVLADLVNAFVTRINADSKRRVNAANVAGDIVVTARVKPSTTELNAIDEYSQVTFEVAMFSDNYAVDTVVTTVPPVNGFGTAAKVRDAEKIALSHKGITNRISFPVIKPELRTDMSETYSYITIISDREYVSADNQYVKTAPQLVQIYLPFGGDQRAAVIAALNPWMASLPRPFPAIV